MHDAAVSTFRVVDAPHAYIRRKLGLDQEQPAAATSTETNGVPPSQQLQPYQTAPPPQPPPPVQTQDRTISSETERRPPAEARPTATPRVVETEARTSQSNPDGSTPRTSTESSGDFPYAKPVPGKPGYVFSPYDPNGGYVDVKGYSPGQKVKDPYSGKVFLVP